MAKEYVSKFDYMLVRKNIIELITKDEDEICEYIRKKAREEIGFEMENKLTFKEAKRLMVFMGYYLYKTQEI